MITTSTGLPGRRDAELPVAGEGDRPEVALGQPVRGDERPCEAACSSSTEYGSSMYSRLRRVVQALEVVGQPEDRRAFGGLVAADALEHAGPVVEPVRADVDRGVAPVDELAVHPDLLGLAHLLASLAAGYVKGYVAASTASMGCARASRIMSRRRDHGHVARRAGSDPDPLVSEQAPVDEDTVDVRAAGTAQLRPATNPVARSTSSGLAMRAFSAAGRGRDLRRVRAPVSRDEHDDPASVAVEDERLDDLGELAADSTSRVDRGRRALRELLDPRLDAHLAQESRATRSTASGH